MPASNWQEFRIGDLGEVFTGRTPPTEHPTYFGEYFPFITPGDMHQGKYARETQRSLSHEGAELLKRIKLPANSVCVSCIGWQMGEVVMTDRPSFSNQQINTIVPNGKVDPSFLYYSLRTRKQELLSLGSATGVRTPILNKSAFCDTKVVIPPLPVQQCIAGILSAYDELIDNSQRRIKIIESIALALYREWFVHFRFPDHKGLPRMATSLGEIPKGWEVKKLFDLAKVAYGKNLPTKNLIEDGAYPVYGAAKIIGQYNEFTREHRTIICGCRGSVGEMQISRGPCFVTNNSFTFDPTHGDNFFWLYLTLAMRGLRDVIGGAAQPQITLEGISSVELATPPMPLRSHFQAIVLPMFQQAWALDAQVENLQRTRDLLLPRLLSGQIDVEKDT
ncbi:MAG: restriction endonuclease subunit S [Desulfobacteraceae bacterium]|nr:restriction endonuclease subunit S [Desulfobacteraceae bacterium]